MLAMFNNQPIFGPRGPAGPDGNPIGTIISYMGVSAPTDYLICDGSVYSVSDYSKLAEFFKTQFGSSNFFGGDGTTTFAVPDMRNLFLRGFHGASEEQLSGEVGVKQEGTEFPYYAIGNSTFFMGSNPKNIAIENADSSFNMANSNINTALRGVGDTPAASHFTSRPVNMAVLYCIKASPSEPILEEYDTDDGWHVRKWSDGYVEMTYNLPTGAISMSVWTAAIFASGSYAAVDYPIELRELYAEDVSLKVTASTGSSWVGVNLNLEPLKKTSSVFIFSSQPSGEFVIVYNIKGRWK